MLKRTNKNAVILRERSQNRRERCEQAAAAAANGFPLLRRLALSSSALFLPRCRRLRLKIRGCGKDRSRASCGETRLPPPSCRHVSRNDPIHTTGRLRDEKQSSAAFTHVAHSQNAEEARGAPPPIRRRLTSAPSNQRPASSFQTLFPCSDCGGGNREKASSPPPNPELGGA